MTEQHPLDRSIELTRLADGRYQGSPPKPYWNIVGPYGGISAAIALNAVLMSDKVLGEPLSLTVNFTAPIRDVPFEVAIEVVRSSRTTQHWLIAMTQPHRSGQRTDRVLQAMLTTGVRRPLWTAQSGVAPVAPLPPEKSHRRTGRAGLPWFDCYDQRFTSNPMKAADPSAEVLTWVRDEPPRTLDFPALAAACDTFFPAIFAERQKISRIATVSMNTYFHTTAAELARIGSAYLLTSSRSSVYHEGFCDAEGKVWAGERLIATSQQVMWYGD